jgi:hypothetical protein
MLEAPIHKRMLNEKEIGSVRRRGNGRKASKERRGKSKQKPSFWREGRAKGNWESRARKERGEVGEPTLKRDRGRWGCHESSLTAKPQN